MSAIKIIECPRDAMQGLESFVPTELKVEYINLLLKCGFDTLDFGSFVSPKAIPQMRDTAMVLDKLERVSSTKLLAIIANERGAEDALCFPEIACLGFPFSISEIFQQRNANSSIEESILRLEKIQSKVTAKKKDLIVYLSMGFGNPYGEVWNTDLVVSWSRKLVEDLGIHTLALSDTIGCAKSEDVSALFNVLSNEFPSIEIGAHFHTRPETSSNLISSAYTAGCRRFDTAIRGFGGCPMAKDDLTGNLPTEDLVSWLNDSRINHPIQTANFNTAFDFSSRIFETLNK
ncbi:MAG: hydroxymethylglutaryl-CoA lyase [Flavobacteriia bacterium]|nr:hydroxymethylglutaryl-CoA lyase [Flavobacteriia bacterium]